MRYRCFSIVLVVIAMFSCTMSSQAQQQEDIVDRVSKAVGVRMPSEYEANIRENEEFMDLFDYQKASNFTEQFIKDQMSTDWGIDKQNQLLFIWDAIYEQVTKNQIYTGEDGNSQRLKEFEKVMEITEECGKKYKAEFRAYMRKLYVEIKQRSAEARQKSVEITRKGISALISYWKLCKEYPNAVDINELDETKKYAKYVLNCCNEYNIDYKKELTPEILKFYGIE